MKQIGGDWGSSWDYGGIYSDGETAYAIDGMETEYTDREEPADPKQRLYRWDHDKYWYDYLDTPKARRDFLSSMGQTWIEFMNFSQDAKWVELGVYYGYGEFDNNGFEGPLYVTEAEWDHLIETGSLLPKERKA